MAPDPVQSLLAELIERLESEVDFDAQAFVAAQREHGPELRARLAKLQEAGLLAPRAARHSLVEELRTRFGLESGPATPGSAAMPAADDELTPARVVAARYRVLGEIGRGGMGRVFRALDVELGREVALKVIDRRHAADAAAARAFLERFLNEAQLTSQLEHPSIVPLHDIGLDAGQPYYTMKLVEGRTLEEALEDWHDERAAGRPLPVRELLRIVLQVCDALAFAHERGVIHRDVKPANVMIGRFGEVHLMDWGLAKRLGASEPSGVRTSSPPRPGSPTRAGQVLGTPSHMAPEQARGEVVDQRADVYGVGALLFHALMGAPPSPVGIASWAKVPHELAALCRKSLEPERERRYSTAADLAADLRAYLDMRPGIAWRDNPWRRTVKLVRRRAAAVAASCAVLLAVIAALVLALYDQETARTESLGKLLESEKRLSAEQQKRVAAEQARADVEGERALLNSLIPGLLEGTQIWAVRELHGYDVPDISAACTEILAQFRRVGLPLDGAEPLPELLSRLERVRELSPAAHAQALAKIEELAQIVERPQLYCVMLFCEGRFEREVSERRRPLWERYCQDHPALLGFLPRLDALVDGLTTDPWRQDVWRAYRARRRDVAPWPARILAEMPERPADVLFLGTMLAGDPDRSVERRAVEVLERAAEVLPDEYWPHFLLAVSKTSRERPELLDLEGALVHAYRAVAIKPESYQALNNLGSALMWLERNEEALFALERAVRLGPWNAQGQGNLGETLRRLGRLPEALAAHERSLELSARATGFLNRALAHKDLGDGGAAEVDVRRALELEPHYTKAWIVLAEALELQGRRDEALQELDRALERLPSSVELEELRARLLDAASGG